MGALLYAATDEVVAQARSAGPGATPDARPGTSPAAPSGEVAWLGTRSLPDRGTASDGQSDRRAMKGKAQWRRRLCAGTGCSRA